MSPITKPAKPAKPAAPGAKPAVPGAEVEQPGSKKLILGVILVLVAFGVSVGLSIRDRNASFGSPSGSWLRYVEDVVPTRSLSIADIARTGSTCLSGKSLVLSPGGSGCEIIVPPGVRRFSLLRVAASPSMTLTVSRTSEVTQTIDTAKAGPDRHHPSQLRFAVPYDGATLTLFNCQGPGPCRVDVGG